MAVKKKNKPGRPKSKDPVKVRYVYLNKVQEEKIKSGYKSLTEAVLAKCG